MAEKPTRAAKVSVSQSDPRVQQKLAQKHAEAAQKAEQAMRAAFAQPVEIAGVRLYPPNSQTLDAVCQPALMALAQTRLVSLLAYLISHPPAEQIALAQDIVALRNSAASWQDSLSSEDWRAIYLQAMKAWGWVNAKMAGEASFFLSPN
jgi:hypothetical protein